MGKRIGALLLAALLLLCAVPSYAQELILEEPVSEEPVLEEPVLEEPVSGEPISEEPVLEETEPPLLEIESVEIVETKETEEPGLLENCVIQVEETLLESGQAGNASFSRLRAFSAAAYTDSWGAQLSGEASSLYRQMVSVFAEQNSSGPISYSLSEPYTFVTEGTLIRDESGKNTLQWDSEKNVQYQNIRTELAGKVQSAFDAFCYDKPEAFWVGTVKYSYGISFSGSGGQYTGTIKSLTVTPQEKYAGAFQELGAFQNAVNAAAAQVQASLAGKSDRYYIAKAIHDYVCAAVEYGDNDSAHTAAGVFLRKQAVCEGYAKAFRILAKRFGIDSPLIVGTAASSSGTEAHMWNYVQMEDGVWYLVDTTWDDQKGQTSYTYFLAGSGDQGFYYPISQERTVYTNFSGTSYTQNFVAPVLGSGRYHSWTAEGKPENCETSGTVRYRCKYCSAVREEGTGAHQWDGGQIVRAATCTEPGTKRYRCTRCQSGQKEEPIPAAGHKAGNWTVTLAASCTQSGTRCRFCTVCGALLESQTISATGHNWSAYRVTKKATALKTGVKTRSCSRCGDSQKKTIQKLKPYLKVSATSILLKKGQSTSALKVTGMAAGDKVKSWKSSNKKIVKVSSKGKLTAGKKTGKATVTVTLASGVKKKITVKVQSGTVKTIKISGLPSSLRLAKGKTTSLKPVLKPLTSQQKVTYQSSNKKVATVTSKGKIRAKGAGTARITVKSGSKRAVVKVTVPKTKTKKITNVPSKLTLRRGKSKTLKPRRSPSGSDEKITYKSSNRKVATVTSKGKITAKKKGKAVITVKSGKIKVTCTVTVK